MAINTMSTKIGIEIMLKGRSSLSKSLTGMVYIRRMRSDDLSYKPQVQERARSVTSFYNQSAIDVAAAKVRNQTQGDGCNMGYLSETHLKPNLV